jgi:hypothetical protein
MSISDNTLSVDIFTTIRTVLVDADIVITKDDSSTKSASIKPAYVNDRAAMPLIVVNPIAKTEDTFKFGSNQGKKSIAVTVDCYYITTRGIEQMSDQVEAAIKTAVSDGTITEMDLVEITSDYGFVDPNNGTYYIKSLTFIFDRE